MSSPLTSALDPTLSSSSLVSSSLRRGLLHAGIAASLLYIAINVFVPLLFEGYSYRDQTVSELSAVGAPTRTLWLGLLLVYGLLMVAFGYGVWASAGRSRSLRVVGVLLIVNSLLGFLWPPMHSREVLAAGGGTLTDTLHLVWTAVWGVMVMLAIAFGASSFGRQFRVYSIATIVTLGGLALMTGTYANGIQANLPTPWAGVVERISIAAFMLWVIVFALLLRAKGKWDDLLWSQATTSSSRDASLS